MDPKEKSKEYVNGDLTVIWKPGKCIHAAVCVKTLPEVYDPNAKPWIKAENASIDALKAQIEQCPSGALTYKMAGHSDSAEDVVSEATSVELIKNGPMMVKGTVSIAFPDGSKMEKERSTAFCRCGASENKPFCDGAHKKVGFEG